MFDRLVRRLLPRSLLGRLIVIVVLIDGLAAFTLGAVIVRQAREATAVEIASAMKTAELLVTDTIGVMRDADAPLLLQTIDLQFASVRHVRISVTDPDGRPVEAPVSAAATTQAEFGPLPPAWFSRLIAPSRAVKVIPVLLRNRLVGNVTVTSEPADEVAEAWHYARALLEAGLALSLAALLLATLLFGRVLKPLAVLAAGLQKLKSRDFGVRLPRPALQDLAVITDHFNRTAEALDEANAENRHLNRQLVTAQDDERRRTALELHDEVGPCLFALNANASSLKQITRKLDDGGHIHERADEVLSLIQQVQGINRRVLDRLRPMGLGHVPLSDCLLRVLVDLSESARPAIEHEIGPLDDTYGRLVDLTVYRCVQEGLFNAIRHAHADRVDLTVVEVEDRDGRRIEISIKDDGRGLAHPPRFGIGLTGMRERVDALGGSFALASPGGGTTLSISVPLEAVETGRSLQSAVS